jgi:Fe2+ transport system protein B
VVLGCSAKLTVLSRLLLGFLFGTIDDLVIFTFYTTGQIWLLIVDVLLVNIGVECLLLLVFRV